MREIAPERKPFPDPGFRSKALKSGMNASQVADATEHDALWRRRSAK
jgi:hypothetical protein